MADTACPSTCHASAACCCDERLNRLEKRVCRIRTWLLIALGVLIFLIGIAIGKGGERRDGRPGPVPGLAQRRAMMPRMGMPPMGPGAMHGPMGGHMGPGPGPGPGPGADRGPDGGPDRDPADGPRGKRGRRGDKDD